MSRTLAVSTQRTIGDYVSGRDRTEGASGRRTLARVADIRDGFQGLTIDNLRRLVRLAVGCFIGITGFLAIHFVPRLYNTVSRTRARPDTAILRSAGG